MMLFGKEIIDLIDIKKAKPTPSYILNLKQALIMRNEESLNTASDEPQFAIENMAHKKNYTSDYVFV